MAGKEIAALVIVALVAIGAVYVVTSSNKPVANSYGLTITVQIYGQIKNSTVDIPASYDPRNFSSFTGEKVTLRVENTDNVTHGLAVPKFSVDTGPISPNGTVTISFTPTAAANYTYDEPEADCGGGSCDVGQAMNGWFLVQT